jgi:large subunit ribosomal protein L10
MSKYIKGLIENELKSVITDNSLSEFVVVSIMGVGGIDNNVMRGELKQKGVRLAVVKNSLFKRALASESLENAGDLFDGPCAIVYGGDSIVDVAKDLTDWKKKLGALKIKGAYLDGTLLDAKGAANLAKMPTRKELQAQVAATITAPGAKLAGSIAGPASLIAGCVKSIVEKAEKEAA